MSYKDIILKNEEYAPARWWPHYAYLADPSEHIESRDYFSWERYFTRLLTEKTAGTYLQYSKNQINPAYLKGQVRDLILKEMQKIKLN